MLMEPRNQATFYLSCTKEQVLDRNQVARWSLEQVCIGQNPGCKVAIYQSWFGQDSGSKLAFHLSQSQDWEQGDILPIFGKDWIGAREQGGLLPILDQVWFGQEPGSQVARWQLTFIKTGLLQLRAISEIQVWFGQELGSMGAIYLSQSQV